MPPRITLLLTLVAALSVQSGCGRRYVIQGDEARFAAETLQNRDTVRVAAESARSGRTVFVELRARDRARVHFDLDPEDAPTERHVLSQLRDDAEFVDRIEVSPKNFGPVFWGTGLGVFGAGWLISAMSATLREEGELAVPVVGPAIQYYRAVEDQPDCINEEDSAFCGWDEGLNALAAATALAVELVGLALIITGAVIHVRNDREAEASDRPADWVQWIPFSSPLGRDGAVAGIVGRF